MSKLFKIVLLLISPIILFLAVGEYEPADATPYSFPFIAGNDTILSAANLTSSTLLLSRFRGAVTVGLEFTVIGSGTAKAIDVYWKERLSGMNWGVPFDSIGVDSLFLGTIDSIYVKNGDPVYFKLANESWWGYIDQGQIILDPATGADSVYVTCRVRGQ